jgi:hypothetical protein
MSKKLNTCLLYFCKYNVPRELRYEIFEYLDISRYIDNETSTVVLTEFFPLNKLYSRFIELKTFVKTCSSLFCEKDIDIYEDSCSDCKKKRKTIACSSCKNVVYCPGKCNICYNPLCQACEKYCNDTEGYLDHKCILCLDCRGTCNDCGLIDHKVNFWICPICKCLLCSKCESFCKKCDFTLICSKCAPNNECKVCVGYK